ncbi:MAG TPA: DEAD/DEAH box helicase [Solirubrobacteraceae bacterium]|nr:DEAD/DEAH box helicase [Solirubrobacteraceae bacterium]
MAIERTIEPWNALLDDGRADGRLVRGASEGPTAASLVDVPADLHPDVLAALARAGIKRLYSHQAQALEAAWEGPLIVTTGTASGKSLCFNLPTLEVLCRDAHARALYLYPTKALAQDQARALARFGLGDRLRPAIYDGDTPREARTQIRRRAGIVLTNPDMLHLGILPHHESWGNFFANLAVVVIDEAHVYRGVFGSHVANVMRRLRRVAAAYGTAPRFLLASATIANPRELAERLTGLEGVTLIDEDGAPAPRRRIAIWNPPLTDSALGARRSTLGEAAELLARLVRDGARAICFMKSRKGVELLSRLVREELDGGTGDAGAGGGRGKKQSARGSSHGGQEGLADLVVPYRAGYTPQQRRELEGRLMRGELRAVITTDALELGIDIGELDAAVVVTFPGTVASLRQMWGRAGRRGQGLAVYIAGEDALDQFFCRHPDEFLERPVEAAILDHENPSIHLAHLLCAAFEGPLSSADAEILGPRWEAYAEILLGRGQLRRRSAAHPPAAYVPRNPADYPAASVSLRSASLDAFAIVDVSSGELLGTTEAARAFSTVHQGAIYLHMGRSYEVCELDLERRRALVAPFDGDWYTQPKRATDTTIESVLDRRDVLGVSLSFGEVSVTDTVLAYQRRRLAGAGGHQIIDLVPLDLPETSFSTQALWFELDPDALAACVPERGVRAGAAAAGASAAADRDAPPPAGAAAGGDDEAAQETVLGALHAAEHAQIAVLPLIAMCDRWDIGGLSTNLHPQTGLPTIFIYDGHPGGVGLTRAAFLRFEELCRDAHRLIAECPCRAGCPSCVQSPKCGNLNEPLAKGGARLLLEGMLAVQAAT